MSSFPGEMRLPDFIYHLDGNRLPRRKCFQLICLLAKSTCAKFMHVERPVFWTYNFDFENGREFDAVISWAEINHLPEIIDKILGRQTNSIVECFFLHKCWRMFRKQPVLQFINFAQVLWQAHELTENIFCAAHGFHRRWILDAALWMHIAYLVTAPIPEKI